jgi:5-oxoprolinase (ATP-hydrolysing) subunit C
LQFCILIVGTSLEFVGWNLELSPMGLKVLDPGLHSLLVDFGRPASRGQGVPIGGGADAWSLALGNALVGNPPDAVALEVTLTGPTLRAEIDVGCVLFGAPFDLANERQPLIAGKTFTLKAGETLRIRGTPRAARAYLCVPGGFLAPSILGSRSALEPVHADQTLVCSPSSLPARFLPESAQITFPSESPRALRVLPGSQADWFAPAALAAQSFSVTNESNRMGLRLNGQPLVKPQRELVSEPVCPGAIQVANDGQCIVLGVDGQTIGGYPKIAQVIRADLDLLGQCRPGDSLRFVEVELDQAEDAYRRKLDDLHLWLARLAVAAD